MKVKKDRRYHVMTLLLITMVMVVGYALFSETLNISGTAETTGTFDVEFQSATLNAGSTLNAPGSTATVSGDKNTLTIDVPDLKQPGSKAVFDVTIRNNGTIAAELLGVNFTGNSDPDIQITYAPTFTPGATLAAGATYNFSITVEWISSSVAAPKTLNFTAAIDYQQD